MWNKQQQSGIIEGWHGDGNFARTTIMYCLWKTGGVYLSPWRDDLKIGGVYRDDKLYLTITSPSDWKGRIMFDRKRHSDYMHLPLDWPRINQFPEYFTVEKEKRYEIKLIPGKIDIFFSGEELLEGLQIKVKGGVTLKLIVQG